MKPATLPACLASLILLAAAARAGDAPWWQSSAAGTGDSLQAILGDDPAGWLIQNSHLQPVSPTVTNLLNQPVLMADARGLRLTRTTLYPAGIEITIRCLFPLKKKETAWFRFAAGIKSLTNAQERTLWFSSSAQAGAGHIQCQAADPVMESNKVPATTAYLKLDGIGDRSLSWPDALRRVVERESASLSSLETTWVTLRVQLLERGYVIYVNDRLLLERQNIPLDTRGMFRLEFSAKATLASCSIRPLPVVDPAYLPARIDSYVNARNINGTPLDHAGWPSPDAPILVQGIPFLFPAPDAQGRDHIDVGASWLQSCYMDGHMDPQHGPFGGRWPSPFVRNPARIEFQIPNRRYRAVHVVAAADGEADSVPVLTLQFYRVGAGAPVNVAGRVPLFSASSSNAPALPVRLESGKAGNLYLVTIPIDPGVLAKFDDQASFAVELTKEVRLYRCYPDPSYYSFHAAGLPSSVRVFAMTFETPRVSLSLTPEAYAGVWTAPKQPSYTVALTNFTAAARVVTVEVATVSYDGSEKTVQKKPVSVPARLGAAATFPLALKRYGYHDVSVKLTDGDQSWNEATTLAYLHEDTRERGGWEPGKGICFGSWCWRGGHGTPAAEKEIEILALAGGECEGGSFEGASDAVKAIAQKYGMVSFKQFSGGDHYVTAALAGNLTKTTEQAAVETFLTDLRKTETKPSPITQLRYVSFYPEPHIGPITSGSLPEYFGEPPYVFPKDEEDRFQYFIRGLLVGAPIVKQHWPNIKILLPHGDPMFTALFVRKSPEARKWIDGLAVDIPVFERLPEQQIHQVSLHRLWMCTEEWRKAGKTNMVLPMYEGPCLPSRPGALTQKEFADQMVRCALILNAYGIDQFPGAWSVFECSGYWGEQHYGGGLMHRMPHESPKPAYAAHAAMTRLLNRSNFKGWLPTGSLSAYATRYQHYKTGAFTHVLWTIRGRRPVTLTVPAGTKATVFDMMDNATELTATNGTLTFTIESEPRMVQGLGTNVQIALGEPDHGDAAPSATARRLSNLGDGWKLSEEPDTTYADNYFYQQRRFPGRMSVHPETAPATQGARAAAVTLEKQEKERLIMPYYTTLVPRKPVEIPGKASHLGLWVRAASDWGRVVYSLRDAKGERWISVGTKDEWNCDDIHNWSMFCFDGWRYLRFELPANSPYDTFREHGTTWWGHFEKGDGIVDLPLRIEKVFVERRTHAMHVNDPQPTRPDDVLLADLYAEYEQPEDAGNEAVRLSRVRMPVPEGIPDVGNPIPGLEADGIGPAIAIKNTTLPEQHADGTQCYVHFDPVDGAKGYQVWVSPYPTGQGALLLGKDWKAPGQMLRGLRPDTDFYLFLAYTDKDGKPSKPSKPYRVNLKDIFGMK